MVGCHNKDVESKVSLVFSLTCTHFSRKKGEERFKFSPTKIKCSGEKFFQMYFTKLPTMKVKKIKLIVSLKTCPPMNL